MKNKKLKVAVIIASVISIIIIGILAYFFSKNKEIETSAQPTEELLVEESVSEEDANLIEETVENTIEEQVEGTEQNNTTNKTTDNSDKKNNQMPYYIKVNYGAQVVTIYKQDTNREYTIPVKAMICSTGTATPTSGVYSIPGRWKWGALFGNVYGQYCIKITGNILFHSVPYLRKGDPGSIEYWEYDKLGTAASAGCIRLKVDDLIWLYNNCGNGTKVEFYSSSNPGPLGKPSAKKISGNEACRNWDPTDPNPNNPWKNYKEQQKNNTNNSQKETTNNTTNNESKNNNAKSDETKNNNTNNNIEDNSNKNNDKKNNDTKANTSVTNEIVNKVESNKVKENKDNQKEKLGK